MRTGERSYFLVELLPLRADWILSSWVETEGIIVSKLEKELGDNVDHSEERTHVDERKKRNEEVVVVELAVEEEANICD